MKTVRGKRLPINVPKSATCANIRDRAIVKWSAFDRKFDGERSYVLLYEDGTEALFMPGECFYHFSTKIAKLKCSLATHCNPQGTRID